MLNLKYVLNSELPENLSQGGNPTFNLTCRQEIGPQSFFKNALLLLVDLWLLCKHH